MSPHTPWWRTLGDRPMNLDTPAARAARRRLARVFQRLAWLRRQRDAEPWIDLGGEAG